MSQSFECQNLGRISVTNDQSLMRADAAAQGRGGDKVAQESAGTVSA
jgi:hypothetical protein